jgi:hypothetical protein
VDDLDHPRRCLVFFTDFVRSEQSRIDQRTKHLLGRFAARIAEYRQKLVPLADCAGALGGHQVAEELAHDGDAIGSDPVDRVFGVPRQGAADAADAVIRNAGQKTCVAIPFLPQLRRREREQRQSAPFTLHLGQHLVHQRVVLEAVAALGGRLYQRTA